MEAAAGKREVVDLVVRLLGADAEEIGQPSHCFPFHLLLELQRE